MTNSIKLIIFIIIAATVVLYLDNRIKAYDMRFYYGKDDGVFSRLESICMLSSLFYLLMDKRIWLVGLVVGFVIGLVSSIVAFVISGLLTEDTGLLFHVTACAIFVLSFYLFRKTGLLGQANSGQ